MMGVGEDAVTTIVGATIVDVAIIYAILVSAIMDAMIVGGALG